MCPKEEERCQWWPERKKKKGAESVLKKGSLDERLMVTTFETALSSQSVLIFWFLRAFELKKGLSLYLKSLLVTNSLRSILSTPYSLLQSLLVFLLNNFICMWLADITRNFDAFY